MDRLTPDAEYGRFRYENRLHYVRGLLALAVEEPEGALDHGAACLDHAARFRMPKYEVRGLMLRGEALRRLAPAEAATELSAAAEMASRLGYVTLEWRAWSSLAEVSASAKASSRAQAAARTIAASLDDDLRRRFLATIARSRP